MKEIFVKNMSGMRIFQAAEFEKSGDMDVRVDGALVARYRTEAARDRAWAMLEKAIATGVRLFRFPTDAELEKGEDE